VWIDADAMVVDGADDIARDAGTRSLALVHHRIGGTLVPNTGVMVMRRGPATSRLLERVWHQSRFVHHPWWENAALIEAVGGDGAVGLTTRRAALRARRTIAVLPHRWNSIPPCPAPSPAIVHLAGVPHDRRLELMAGISEGAGLVGEPAGASPPTRRGPGWVDRRLGLRGPTVAR